MNKYLNIDFATFHQLMLHAIPSYIFQNPEDLRQLSWTIFLFTDHIWYHEVALQYITRLPLVATMCKW